MPMKRHQALTTLSRDHHLALLLARAVKSDASAQLRATVPADPRALADHVCRFFDDELEAHFKAEEDVLIPAVARRDVALDALGLEIVTEHAEMRALVRALRDPGAAEDVIVRTLDRFGRQLEAHVRKEERSFYEGVQAVLSPTTLENLGTNLQRHIHTTQESAR